MFDFVVKIMGSRISSLIYFLSIQLSISNNTLNIDTALKDPITMEIVTLMEQGYLFKLEYYGSIIVNNKQVYKDTIVNSLEYRDGWWCNGEEISYDSLQRRMGDVSLSFPDYSPVESDTVSTFIKATIVADSLFEASTGFRTRILWENYVPRTNEVFQFIGGEFTSL